MAIILHPEMAGAFSQLFGGMRFRWQYLQHYWILLVLESSEGLS